MSIPEITIVVPKDSKFNDSLPVLMVKNAARFKNNVHVQKLDSKRSKVTLDFRALPYESDQSVESIEDVFGRIPKDKRNRVMNLTKDLLNFVYDTDGDEFVVGGIPDVMVYPFLDKVFEYLN